MKLRSVCFLAYVSLTFAAAGSNWEVINDEKPFDDSGTQEDILSQEELIPFKPSKPKPAPKQQPIKNAEAPKAREVKKAPLPGSESRGGGDTGEEGLMPLGVGHHDSRRRLLQVETMQLANAEALKRLRLRSDAVNLSKNCKETDDCLFDVDEFVAKQKAKGQLEPFDEDFDFGEDTSKLTPLTEKLDAPLSRHKRQSNNNVVVEGSGTGITDDLYANTTAHENQGKYKWAHNLAFNTSKNGIPKTNEDKEKYRLEIEKELTKAFSAFNNRKPGTFTITVGFPVVDEVTGKLTVNYTITIDGNMLNSGAAGSGSRNAEEYLLNTMKTAVLPLYNNITIFGNPLLGGSQLQNLNVLDLKLVLFDYCSSDNPCPNAGPEFNVTACANTGFLSGYCPHKCMNYPCKNSAICELDSNYMPTCNCGGRWKGEYCETPLKAKAALTTGEKVGVGVAGAVAALSLLACCFFVIFCRRRKRNVNYTYYEDEGSTENNSDPTSIHNYYIDRPIISPTPISVFSPSSSGFDA